MRVRPDEAEGPSLVLCRPVVDPARKCQTTEVDSNPILKSCEDEPRRPVPTQPEHVPTMMGGAGYASAEPRRRITVRRPARPVERCEEQQSGGDDPAREEPPTRRQRVARAVVQLRALVAMTGKTDSDQCWGCNVVFDGGDFL